MATISRVRASPDVWVKRAHARDVKFVAPSQDIFGTGNN